MYIEQGRTGILGMWKYLPIPLGFFSLMFLNYLFTKQDNVDVTALMQAQIERMGKHLFFATNLLPFAVFLGGLFFWVVFVHKQSITSLTTSRSKIDWNRFFFMFGLMTVFIIGSTVISYFLNPELYEIQFDIVNFSILAILALILVPIQTSFEEYLFRGYVLQGLGLATKTRWIPLVVTSVLFGVVHAANPEVEKIGYILMVYYIGTGLFLAMITQMDEGLELALGFHAANNLVTALLVTADWTAFQTHSILLDLSEPSRGYEILIPILVVFPIFMIILAKKYHWKGWKSKLFGVIKSDSIVNT